MNVERAAHDADVRILVVPSLIRVTELTALSSARLMGRGDVDGVREQASASMRGAIDNLGVGGRVVLGPRGDRLLSHGSVLGQDG
ncbi:MAG: fructose-bisphosphatase class II, partial [Candidatus Dormibacteraceae bacterium]